MDVWFDSGSSWAGVTKARKELSYPADIYLEGERFNCSGSSRGVS